MAASDVSASAALPTPRRRRRRWPWLRVASLLLAGGLAACEAWSAWHERLAAQALDDDRMDDARRHVERALWVPPNRTSTLLLAARIRRLRGASAEAEQYLLRCGPPDKIGERVQLEWMLLRCQQGEVDELAPGLLNLVREHHPESPAILETLASVYVRQTRYLEALLCLNFWLELTPDSVRALDWRGWLCNQLDDRGQALSDYEHLLALKPGRSDIRLRLAQILVDSTRHAEALPHLERLLRERPDDPDVRVALAPCRLVQFRADEARALLDGVLEEHPDHFDALLQRGKLELTLEHPAEAEPWLRKALKIKPHDSEACYSLYRSLHGQPEKQQEAESERARWERERDRQNRLNRLMRRELAARPNDPDPAGEVGEILLELGEEQRGLFWLRRALSLNPRHVPSRRALLAYYERTNRPDEAAEQRRQLAELGATEQP